MRARRSSLAGQNSLNQLSQQWREERQFKSDTLTEYPVKFSCWSVSCEKIGLNFCMKWKARAKRRSLSEEIELFVTAGNGLSIAV